MWPPETPWWVISWPVATAAAFVVVSIWKATGVHGTAAAEKITEKMISSHMYDPEMPEPDLVIRTSGEYRISNFLLWELAYSELLFSPLPWPEFRRDDLFAAIAEFQDRERRFGGVDAG